MRKLKNADRLPNPLRDYYSWLKLPGNLGASDLDCVIERHGNFLAIEMKYANTPIPKGQEIMLHALRKQGWVVLIVRTNDDERISIGRLLEYGEETMYVNVSKQQLNRVVNQWFERVNS